MTEDARTQLAGALADPAPDAPLRVLRWAFVLAAQAVRRSDADPGASAIETVIGLDDALSASDQLTDGIPALLAAAASGHAVEEYLAASVRRLSELTAQVTTTRSELEELRRSADDLRERVAEHESLRHEISELRRLERLVTALDGLQEQRRIVDDRVALLTGTVGDVHDRLVQGTSELMRLTIAQLAALDEPTRQAVERVAAAQAALAEQERQLTSARTDLAAATERHESLRTERDLRLTELRAHAQADREIAAAVASFGPGPESDDALAQIRLILDQAEKQLAQVDRALRHVLDAAAERLDAESRPREWAEPPSR